MNTFLRILIGFFIIAHGLVHPLLAVIPDDKVEDAPAGSMWTKSWLFGEGTAAKTLLYVFTGIAAFLLLLAGLSFIGFIVPQAWWHTLWIIGAGVSSLVLVVFWHPRFYWGLIINAVILGLALFTSFSPE
ncbi:MAG: hypothetical protein PVF83_04290 [Anaerolineales bacterium]|jgi:hypothetical protein